MSKAQANGNPPQASQAGGQARTQASQAQTQAAQAGGQARTQASQAAQTGGQANTQAGGQDIETLTNALRFEREKNEVLLNEVVVLEDELVNRQLADFEGVISDETRDFWREQLLSNREAATAALNELRQAKSQGVATRRPLHNRQTARPVPPGQSGRTAEADNTAVRIRNRAHELCKAERIPFSTAFKRAEKEICGE